MFQFLASIREILVYTVDMHGSNKPPFPSLSHIVYVSMTRIHELLLFVSFTHAVTLRIRSTRINSLKGDTRQTRAYIRSCWFYGFIAILNQI